MITPDMMTVLEYGVVAVAAVFFAMSAVNYVNIRRSKHKVPKRAEVKGEVSEGIRVEGIKDFIESFKTPTTDELSKPKTLAEVLEELIMRRLTDVSVSLTVEIPDTTIKLFGNEAKLNGKVIIETRKREVSESEGYPVVVEEEEETEV